MKIVIVDAAVLEAILPLFDQYQAFYRMAPQGREKNRAHFSKFIANETAGILFAALDENGAALGFATLYRIPSSLSAGTTCLLNDLYTVPEYRGKGVARSLLFHAKAYAAANGFPTLEWQTEISNRAAQHLYDRLEADRTEWYYYILPSGYPGQ